MTSWFTMSQKSNTGTFKASLVGLKRTRIVCQCTEVGIWPDGVGICGTYSVIRRTQSRPKESCFCRRVAATRDCYCRPFVPWYDILLPAMHPGLCEDSSLPARTYTREQTQEREDQLEPEVWSGIPTTEREANHSTCAKGILYGTHYDHRNWHWRK
jgi:hypothetical protein